MRGLLAQGRKSCLYLARHANVYHVGFDVAAVEELVLARHKDDLVKTRHAGLEAAEQLDCEACGRHGAIGIVDPEESVVDGEATDGSELVGVAHGCARLELGIGGHVALAGAKVEDVALGAKEDLAGAAGEAELELIVLESFAARLGAGMEVRGDRRRRGAARGP